MTIKPWIKRTVIGVFGAAILFAGIGAYAEKQYGWHGDPAQMKQHMVERISSKLALNDAQKARLGVLADSLQTQRASLMAGGGDARTEMQSLITGPAFDRTRADALLASKLAALQAGAPAVVTAMADFYDSLDAAQQAKVREFVAAHHARGERGMHHGEHD